MMLEAAFAARKPLPKKRAKKRRDSRPRCDRNRCTRPAKVTVWPEGEVCFGDTPPCFTQSFIAREGVCVCASGDAERRTLATLLCDTHAKQEADKLAREIVLERDDHRCVKCGSTEVVQWAHVIRRGSLSTRWLADGAVALCRADHVFFTHREEEWRTWLDANRPGLWERLNAIRIEAADKRTQPDLAEIIASLRSQAASL